MLDKIDCTQADQLLIQYYGCLLKTPDGASAKRAELNAEANRQKFSQGMLNYMNRGLDNLEVITLGKIQPR